MFQVGGTDVFVHKYLGPRTAKPWESMTTYVVGDLVSVGNKAYRAIAVSTNIQPPNDDYWKFVKEGTPTQPIYTSESVFNIDDLLFLENRSRDYDESIYVMRGVYNLQDTDFNLSQFGLFLQNDTIFLTFHINDTVEKLGRKIMAGDVVELPHLKDEYALNDLQFALKRFYVIEEVTRAAEGYSVTWYPHLYRAKCKPMTASQEFSDILEDLVDGSVDTETTVGDTVSTYEKEMQLTQAVLDQAEADVLRSGYDTSKFYHLQKDENGRAELVTVDTTLIDASRETQATDENGILRYSDDIWDPQKTYQVGDYFTYSTIRAGNYIPGRTYTILQVGNTNFISIGASSNTVGTTFIATGPGVGTGVAHESTNMDATRYRVSVAPPPGISPLPPNTNFYEVAGIASPVIVNSYASTIFQSPDSKKYDGYITEDGIPANGAPFTAGIAFPIAPIPGQYCLRKDYLPNRLFRFDGTRWLKIEDNLRMTMSNLGASDVGPGDRFEGKEVRQTQKTSFINNDNVANIDGREVKEKQSLSKALRPQADN